MTPAVTFPARCAVAVVYRDKLIAQVYPAAVPVESFVDSAVELIDQDLRRYGSPGLDPSLRYELQRANGTRLDVSRTLVDLGVADGTTLVLAVSEVGDSFEPQIESLSTGLARVGRQLFPPVTAEAVVRCAMATLAMTTFTILGLAFWVRQRGDETPAGRIALLAGLIMCASAFAIRRWFTDLSDVLDGFAWLSVPAIGIGTAMVAPGRLGAAHVFIACVAVAVLAMCVTGMTGRHVIRGSAVGALSGLGSFVAAIHVWAGATSQQMGIIGLLLSLVLLTAGPTLALRVAGVRPPYFGSITGRDIFRRSDGMPADSVGPVAGPDRDGVVADTTPATAPVVAAAVRANGVLTGICIAVATAIAAAAWATLEPGAPHRGAAVALVLLFIPILANRARAFSDRGQVTALALGASATFCVTGARHVIRASRDPAAQLLWATAGLGVFAAAVLAAAFLVPATRFTPLVRTLAEWIELVAVVVALPLAAWICGLFTLVRMR